MSSSFYETTDIYFNPNTRWGGTWEKIESGRILQATQVNSQVGTRVAAGLPNIEGNIAGLYGEPAVMSQSDGAFKNATTKTHKPGFGTNWVSGNVGFNASLSNSIYGNSDTVQPPALLVVMWHRIA